MSEIQLSIFGMGTGSVDDITLGTLRRLKEIKAQGKPLLVRTERHPSINLLAQEGIQFNRSFDSVYDAAETFDEVYALIVEQVLLEAQTNGGAAYVVPGHPLLGERTVGLLLENDADVSIELVSSVSFIDACLVSARQEADGLLVLDALSLTDNTDIFRNVESLVITTLPQLIYQVYDRQIAGKVKIALLERYPPEHIVSIVSSAGVPGAEKVTRTQLHLLDRTGTRYDHLTSIVIPPLIASPSTTEFSTLLDIMAQLRHPVKGCPWDREQTPETLKQYAVEEVYEVIDAIDEGDVDKYVEELGDLLLQVVFHAQLAREAGDFTIGDVLQSISEKLIRRHPHVFGTVSVRDSTEVLANWEVIKRAEKGNEHRKSRLDGIPRHLPALSLALEMSKRAAKSGFEWQSIDGVFEKLDEELNELREALSESDKTHIASELGDLLFTVVNLARFVKVDSEEALRTMVGRFSSRFRRMEESADRPLEDLDPDAWDALWQASKREELLKSNL